MSVNQCETYCNIEYTFNSSLERSKDIRTCKDISRTFGMPKVLILKLGNEILKNVLTAGLVDSTIQLQYNLLIIYFNTFSLLVTMNLKTARKVLHLFSMLSTFRC